jgi:hypothetical protein
MESLMEQVVSDYADEVILMPTRKFIGDSLDIEQYGFQYLSLAQLLESWPSLARCRTDYFGSKKEVFYSGMARKKFDLFIYPGKNTDLHKLLQQVEEVSEEA